MTFVPQIGYNIVMKATIRFRLDESQRDELETLAKEWDIDLSKLLREIISQWLDEQAKAGDGEIATHLR